MGLSSSISVAMPVYKRPESLTNSEKAIITRVEEILSYHHLYFVVPHRLVPYYEKFNDFTVVSFEDYFFQDKNTYSSLLTSIPFYERFSKFKFLQIIQLDCWIFNDQLELYSSLGFDYIGAPWMKGGFEGKPENKMWKVGNGGFSLRKVDSFLRVLKEIKHGPKGKTVVFKNRFKGILKSIKNTGFRNNLRHYLDNAPGEDIFWSVYVPQIFNNEDFKIADNHTAASYSFEVNPSYLFKEITKKRLPMGCHNWANNEPSFWDNHIQIEGIN
ncbi:MAG: hypothetical protein CMC93_01010 [Flavobacteriaceae bacterium]|nr:hypothetical protein [Flavobacteriaceae bacterium]